MIHTGKFMTQLLTSQLAHDHDNEVHELKEVEVGEFQIVKEQIVTAALTNLSTAFG